MLLAAARGELAQRFHRRVILRPRQQHRIAMPSHGGQIQSRRCDEVVHRILGPAQARKERGDHGAVGQIINSLASAAREGPLMRLHRTLEPRAVPQNEVA